MSPPPSLPELLLKEVYKGGGVIATLVVESSKKKLPALTCFIENLKAYQNTEKVGVLINTG